MRSFTRNGVMVILPDDTTSDGDFVAHTADELIDLNTNRVRYDGPSSIAVNILSPDQLGDGLRFGSSIVELVGLQADVVVTHEYLTATDVDDPIRVTVSGDRREIRKIHFVLSGSKLMITANTTRHINANVRIYLRSTVAVRVLGAIQSLQVLGIWGRFDGLVTGTGQIKLVNVRRVSLMVCDSVSAKILCVLQSLQLMCYDNSLVTHLGETHDLTVGVHDSAQAVMGIARNAQVRITGDGHVTMSAVLKHLEIDPPGSGNVVITSRLYG